MTGAIYLGLLAVLAWLQLPELMHQGQRRTVLVWAVLGAAAAGFSILAFWGTDSQGAAEWLAFGS